MAGNLEVRLARTSDELEASQALRYQVFVGEIGAVPTEENKAAELDRDIFDGACDHLLVLESDADGKQRVVGSYRLLRREPMQRVGHFYTSTEYDISTMLAYDGEILEVGRSCVHPDFRNRSVMQLLWRGIAAYIETFNVNIMFGCGSLYDANIDKHKQTLSYLYHYHLAPEHLRIKALPDLYCEMNWQAKEAIEHPARIFASLPPLIKGYLRLGGFVGEGAVLDPVYNTTDVAIIVNTDVLTNKYLDRYASQTLKETIRGE